MFEYNASLLRNASNASIAAHARSLLNDVRNERLQADEKHRPLIFVAHSLGGLVVKQALTEATINKMHECLHTSIYGLVCFATPHLGYKRAGPADVAAKIGRATFGEPASSLLTAMGKGSLINEILSDQFSHQVNKYAILTFYETKPVSLKIKRCRLFPQVTRMEIVGRESAKLRVERETALEIDRNHSDICKFARSGDEAYERVGSNLRAMANEAQTYQVECSHAPPRTVRESHVSVCSKRLTSDAG